MNTLFKDLKYLFSNYPKTAIALLASVFSFILISILFSGAKIEPEVGEEFLLNYYDKSKTPTEVCSVFGNDEDDLSKCMNDKKLLNSDSNTYTVEILSSRKWNRKNKPGDTNVWFVEVKYSLILNGNENEFEVNFSVSDNTWFGKDQTLGYTKPNA